MRTTSRIVLAVATALVAVAPAARAAVPQRYFAVSVKGVQTTKSSYTRTSTGACDPAATSSGSERVVFHTVRSKVMLATYFDNLGLVSFGLGKPGEDVVSAVATISRASHYTHGAVDPSCLGSGGGGTAPTPDCGTRRRALPVRLAWRNPLGIQLESPDFGVPAQPFQNCPVSGTLFPMLLTSNSHGKDIVARIPGAELFDHRWREHILVGSGRSVSGSAGNGATTTVRWEVTLKAVPPPENPHAKVY